MPAYIIGNISIKDAEKWAEYCSRVPDTLLPFGGELIFRGTSASVLSGQYRHSQAVAIRFPDPEHVARWHASEQYQQLVPLRMQAADVDLVRFEEG